MATVGIALVSVSNVVEAGLNSVQPVPDSSTAYSESKTSSASSQQSSTVVPQRGGLLWEIVPSGGAVWVTFGPNPVASAGVTFQVPDGAVRHFKANAGDKAAIIDG